MAEKIPWYYAACGHLQHIASFHEYCEKCETPTHWKPSRPPAESFPLPDEPDLKAETKDRAFLKSLHIVPSEE